MSDPNTSHIVLVDFGPRLGLAWTEVPAPIYTKDALLADLENGKFNGDVVKVVAFNLTTGTCADVTKHIGELVYDAAERADRGFTHLSECCRQLLKVAGLDLDAAQDAWNRAQERETLAWFRHTRSFFPSRQTHL